MRLQKLELKGFKSFADHTVINFNEDVIGIVGPNGSGKSNIVDAIRWVLGEQKNKELRLDKMTSVIFNGSKSRKQSGVAQVSLTFENTKNLLPTEYNVVTITRLLYRTGESEYRLNNVPCRLKDIRSLFMDTGIGSNSYAIIALGMTEDILQDKDNNRRLMLEQAAGISKYKQRKRETLNKLKGTEADLDRVDDLLFEINNNLKMLEKQAKRTQRYFDLKENYKTLSIQYAIHGIKDTRTQFDTLNQRLQESENKYRELSIALNQEEANLESEKQANLDKEKDLSGRQKAANELIEQLRKIESDKQITEQKVDFIQQNSKRLEEGIETANTSISQIKAELEQYDQRINSAKSEENALFEQYQGVKQLLDTVQNSHGSARSELDIVLKLQRSLEAEVLELEKEKANALGKLDNYEFELRKVDEDILNKDKEMEILNKDLSEQESAYKLKEQEIEQKASEAKQIIEDRDEVVEKLETEEKNKSDLERKLDARMNELDLLQSLVDNQEGFPESIKFLSQSQAWTKQAPLLTDIIYVDEPYRVAIENYLNNYLNYYVVKNYKEAYSAIQLLSDAQKGKANFFLLDLLNQNNQSLTNIPGAKSAMDVVKYDAEYKPLVEHLLGSVYITEGDLNELQTLPQGVSLLAKNGGLSRGRFTLSGGSVGLFEGKKIGRKKNLELVTKEVASLSDRIKEIDKQIKLFNAEIERLDELLQKADATDLKNELSALNQKRAGIQSRLETISNFAVNLKSHKESIQRSMAEIRNVNSDLEQKLGSQKNSADKVKMDIASADGSFQKLAEELSRISSDYNEKHIAYIQKQNQIDRLGQEYNFKKERIQDLQAEIMRLEGNKSSEAEELKVAFQSIEKLSADLQDMYLQKDQRMKSLNEFEHEYYQAKEQIDGIENKIRKFNKNLQEKQIDINQTKDKITEYKMKLQSIGDRLNVEFNIPVKAVIEQEPDDAYSLEELEPKVAKLKNRLDNYGEINPMAVEAYNEMKIRHDTINGQREDILEAKQSLLDTIGEIEQTATVKFQEAFEVVRENFREVFRSLFTKDDDCDLRLEFPDQPLDSRIKIMAKPKGKRPQSISQLSGGEKTLTATAFLFALYLYKPAPFCIFDEVDAPLDDSNILKFNKIIKKFSEESQFVIVTHNKLTMAAVDIIYGVYMQDQGVSGLSGVDFRALNEASELVLN